MMQIPLIYVKDKQAFSKSAEGSLILIGKPTELAREWKKKGIKLIHIVDLDAEQGNEANFDVYDHLTYAVNIQVEGVGSVRAIGRLLGINARVVVPLPSKLDLPGLVEKKRLLVGRIGKNFKGDANEVFDIIIDANDKSGSERFKKTDKRIIIDCSSGASAAIRKFGKSIFGILVTPDSL